MKSGSLEANKSRSNRKDLFTNAKTVNTRTAIAERIKCPLKTPKCPKKDMSVFVETVILKNAFF